MVRRLAESSPPSKLTSAHRWTSSSVGSDARMQASMKRGSEVCAMVMPSRRCSTTGSTARLVNQSACAPTRPMRAPARAERARAAAVKVRTCSPRCESSTLPIMKTARRPSRRSVDIHSCAPHRELVTISSRSSVAHSARGRSFVPRTPSSSCSSSAPAKVVSWTIRPSRAANSRDCSARAIDARSLAST